MKTLFLIGTVGLAACLSLILTMVGIEHVNSLTGVAFAALAD